MALQPVAQPIGIFLQFFAKQTETLVLKERLFSLSGDSFTVHLLNHTPLIQIEGGKWSSWSSKRKILDLKGVHLFTLKKLKWHMHTTFTIEDPNEQELMEVKNSYKLTGTKATAKFVGQNGKQETLQMTGNWRSSKAEITDESQGGVVIARINRSSKGMLIGKQTYNVDVAPGVDLALMTALCICLDEKHNEGAAGAAAGGAAAGGAGC